MAPSEEQRADAAEQERHWQTRLLNESQRRSLAIVLRRVELAVWRLEDRLSRATSPQLTLTRFTNPPDAAQRSALLRLVKHVRQEVAQLAADYNLEVSEENVLRGILSEFTLLWTDVEESRPRNLRRYGAMNPQADEVLGPPIQRLIELILAMNDVARGKVESIHLWQETRDSDSSGERGEEIWHPSFILRKREGRGPGIDPQ